MEILRKLSLALVTLLLFLTTIVMIASIFIVHTIGNEEALKTQLKESGLYDAAAESITDEFSINTASLPSNNTIVNQAVEDSLNGVTVKQAAENFISSTFDWLRGEIAQPRFTLRASDVKIVFADNLTRLLQERLSGLPACPANTIPSSTDPFTASCWPPSLSIDTELAKLRTEIETNTATLDDRDLTAADITINTGGESQPYYVALQSLPRYYRLATLTPAIAGMVMLLLFALLYTLGSPHENGLKIAAVAILPIGLVLVVIGSFVPQFSPVLARYATDNINSEIFKEPVQTLATNVIQSTGSLLATKGTMLTILSVLLIIAYLLRSRIRRNKVKTGRLSTLM